MKSPEIYLKNKILNQDNVSTCTDEDEPLTTVTGKPLTPFVQKIIPTKWVDLLFLLRYFLPLWSKIKANIMNNACDPPETSYTSVVYVKQQLAAHIKPWVANCLETCHDCLTLGFFSLCYFFLTPLFIPLWEGFNTAASTRRRSKNVKQRVKSTVIRGKSHHKYTQCHCVWNYYYFFFDIFVKIGFQTMNLDPYLTSR